jgi:hypothetical protein
MRSNNVYHYSSHVHGHWRIPFFCGGHKGWFGFPSKSGFLAKDNLIQS